MRIELPDLSVITPSFNQARFLPFCLDSIELNRPTCRIEHLVLDGGSTDGSVDILVQRSKDIEYWRSERDGGQSHAINTGMTLANGNVLCWINSDDALAPGAAARMVSLLGSCSAPAWAIGQCLIVDESNNEIKKWVPRSHNNLEFVLRWSRNFIMQPAVFWNRPMWNVAGPLDEQLHLAMDFDLWLRFFKIANPVLFDQPIGVHRTHGESKTSYAGVRILDEYRRALTARLSENHRSRHLGEADVAHVLSFHARSALFNDDPAGAGQLLGQALSLAPLRMLCDPSFLRGALKLGVRRATGGLIR
jgi:glycosyltransferase involved in cell wall biosynthesis